MSAGPLLLFAVLISCSKQEEKTPPDELAVQLKWIHQVLLDEQIIAAPLQDLSKAYTMQFLEAVYGGETR
jgi:hypothetical protein